MKPFISAGFGYFEWGINKYTSSYNFEVIIGFEFLLYKNIFFEFNTGIFDKKIKWNERLIWPVTPMVYLGINYYPKFINK